LQLAQSPSGGKKATFEIMTKSTISDNV